MRCYPDDDPDELAERRASRFVAIVCGVIAASYLIAIILVGVLTR